MMVPPPRCGFAASDTAVDCELRSVRDRRQDDAVIDGDVTLCLLMRAVARGHRTRAPNTATTGAADAPERHLVAPDGRCGGRSVAGLNRPGVLAARWSGPPVTIQEGPVHVHDHHDRRCALPTNHDRARAVH